MLVNVYNSTQSKWIAKDIELSKAVSLIDSDKNFMSRLIICNSEFDTNSHQYVFHVPQTELYVLISEEDKARIHGVCKGSPLPIFRVTKSSYEDLAPLLLYRIEGDYIKDKWEITTTQRYWGDRPDEHVWGTDFQLEGRSITELEQRLSSVKREADIERKKDELEDTLKSILDKLLPDEATFLREKLGLSDDDSDELNEREGWEQFR